MASLTKVSLISRKAIRYSIYFVIFALIARFSIQTGAALYHRLNPEPPPPPSVGFGKLSRLPFPEQEFPNDLTFTLETPEGGLPQLIPEGVSVPVYFMPRLTSGLGVLDEARQMAISLEFNSEGNRVIESVPNVYEFEKNNRPQTLLINIITKTFSISYDLASDRSILSGIPPGQEAATSAVHNYLTNIIAPDILNGRSETEFKRYSGGELVDAASLSEAEMTKVNLYRRAYSELEIPSVTQRAIQANVWFNVAASNNIVNGEYHYYPINEEQVETYPIISAQEAFDRLKNGNAYLAHYGTPDNKDIVIRRVYLAYYDAGQYSEFYQPVVVFGGDNEFYAYVPAVTEEYYGE